MFRHLIKDYSNYISIRWGNKENKCKYCFIYNKYDADNNAFFYSIIYSMVKSSTI